MTRLSLLLPLLAALGVAGCDRNMPVREREVVRSFQVAPASTVVIDISGGAVRVTTGQPGVVNLTLKEEVSARSDREADRQLARYDIALTQERDTVTLRARQRGDNDWGWNHVNFTATVEAPANVKLDVRTSGGRIAIGGDRSAEMKMRSSGGSVRVDGGVADMDISTQGGEIDIVRALGALTARTSGGNIDVRRLSMTKDASISTSGGNVTIGVDRAAAFDLRGETSGGNINIRELANAVTSSNAEQDNGSKIHAVINAGSTRRLIATTSGGNIRIKVADDE